MVVLAFQAVSAGGSNSGRDVDVFWDYSGNQYKVWREEVNGVQQLFLANCIGENNTGIGHDGIQITQSSVDVVYPQGAIDPVSNICYVLWVVNGLESEEFWYSATVDNVTWSEARYGGIKPKTAGNPVLDMYALNYTLYVTWKDGSSSVIASDFDGDFIPDGEDSDMFNYTIVGDEQFEVDAFSVDYHMGVSVAINYIEDITTKPTISLIAEPAILNGSVGPYVDIAVDTNISYVAIIKFKYTPGAIPLEYTEDYLRLYWYNGTNWLILKNSSMNEDTGICMNYNFVWGRTTHLTGFTNAESSQCDSDEDLLSDAEEMNADKRTKTIIDTFSDGTKAKELTFETPGEQVVNVNVPISQGSIEYALIGGLSVQGSSIQMTSYITNTDDYSSHSPNIAAGNNGEIYIIWLDDREQSGLNQIYFKKSMDNGINWSSEVALTLVQEYSIQYIDLAADGSNVAIVWQELNVYQCNVIYSENRGDTWTSPYTIDRAFWPSIAVSESRVCVAFRNIVHSGYYVKTFIGLRWDGNGGLTLENEKVFTNPSPGTELHGIPQVAAYNDNIHVIVCSWDYEQILYWRSTDNGQNWTGPNNLAVWQRGDFVWPEYCTLALRENNLCYMWTNLSDTGNYQIMEISSTSNGESWSQAREISSAEVNAGNPTCAIDAENNRHMSWQEETIDGAIIRYLKSDPSGSLISTNQFSAQEGDYCAPSIAMDSFDNPHLIFQENKNDDFDVMLWEQFYPYSVTLKIGNGTEWMQPGFLINSVVTTNFSVALNRYLSEHVDVDDGIEDGFVTVPMTFSTSSCGFVNIFNINIEISIILTEPLDWDTDNDFLGDGEEIKIYFLNPVDDDYDKDGLLDGAEVLTYFTNPVNPDTDSDGLKDGTEAVPGAVWIEAENFVGASADVIADTSASNSMASRLREDYYSDIVRALHAWKGDPIPSGNYNMYFRARDEAPGNLPALRVYIDVNGNIWETGDVVEFDEVFILTVEYRWYKISNIPFSTGNRAFAVKGCWDNGNDPIGVVLDQIMFVPVASDNGQVTNPKIPDSDWDGLNDGVETVTGAVWLEAESYMSSTSESINDGKASSSKASRLTHNYYSDVIRPLHAWKNDPLPSGAYNIYLRAQDEAPSGIPSLRVLIDVNGNIWEPGNIVEYDLTFTLTTEYDWYKISGVQFSTGNRAMAVKGCWENGNDPIGVILDRIAFVPASADNGRVTCPLDPDFDGDTVSDGRDIDPLGDAMVKVTVTEITELDPADPWPGKFDPYITVWVDDLWDSNQWTHSKVPLAPDANSPLTGSWSFYRNIPDDQIETKIMILAWDDDMLTGADADDGLLDISPNPGGGGDGGGEWQIPGSVLNLTFNVDIQQNTKKWWRTENSGTKIDAGNTWGFSGEEDGSTGSSGSNDQNDALIRLTVDLARELDKGTKQQLAEKFSPEIYFDIAENYFPTDINQMLSQSWLRDSAGNVLAGPPISVDSLYEHASLEDSYMDLSAEFVYDKDTAPHQIYANVFTANDDRIVIQYWFFYIYQDESSSTHEGDWEMIQVILPASSAPLTVTPEYTNYSQHYHSQGRKWIDTPKSGDHPTVYVSYQDHSSEYIKIGNKIPWEYNYIIISLETQEWLSFRGWWGATKSDDAPSPNGPVFRHSRHDAWGDHPIAYIWIDPLYWGVVS